MSQLCPQAVRLLSGACLTTPQGTSLKADTPSPNRKLLCVCVWKAHQVIQAKQTRFPWIPESLKVLTRWKNRIIIKQGHITVHQKEKKKLILHINVKSDADHHQFWPAGGGLTWPALNSLTSSRRITQKNAAPIFLTCKCLTVNQHHKTHSGPGLEALSLSLFLVTFSRSHSPHIAIHSSFPTPLLVQSPRLLHGGGCRAYATVPLPFPCFQSAPQLCDSHQSGVDAMVTGATGGAFVRPTRVLRVLPLALTSPTSRQRQGSKDQYCPYTHLPDPNNCKRSQKDPTSEQKTAAPCRREQEREKISCYPTVAEAPVPMFLCCLVCFMFYTLWKWLHSSNIVLFFVFP